MSYAEMTDRNGRLRRYHHNGKHYGRREMDIEPMTPDDPNSNYWQAVAISSFNRFHADPAAPDDVIEGLLAYLSAHNLTHRQEAAVWSMAFSLAHMGKVKPTVAAILNACGLEVA